jgi:hypothetical protein
VALNTITLTLIQKAETNVFPKNGIDSIGIEDIVHKKNQ